MKGAIWASSFGALLVILAAFIPAAVAHDDQVEELEELADEFREELDDLTERFHEVLGNPSLTRLEGLAEDFRRTLGGLEADYEEFVSETGASELSAELLAFPGGDETVEVVEGAVIITLTSAQIWGGDLNGLITNEAIIVFLPSGVVYGDAFAKIRGTIDGRDGILMLRDAVFAGATEIHHPGVMFDGNGGLAGAVGIASIDHPTEFESIASFVVGFDDEEEDDDDETPLQLDMLTAFLSGITEIEFPEDEEFFVIHGWFLPGWSSEPPAEHALLLSPGTRFDLLVDGVPAEFEEFFFVDRVNDFGINLFRTDFDDDFEGTHVFTGIFSLDASIFGGDFGEPFVVLAFDLTVHFVEMDDDNHEDD